MHFDGKHEPIYVSVSRKVSPEQEKKQVEEILRRDKEYLATYPVVAAERKLVEAEKELAKALVYVNDKEQQLNKLKNEPLGLSLLNPVAHPLKVDWHEIYELPDWGNKNRIKFDFFAMIETKERLNLLLDKGAEALFTEETDWKEVLTKYSEDKVPQDYIDSPTESILTLGEFYQGTAIEQLTLVREQLLKQRTKIKAAEEALVIAMESRKKAEEKKKAAEDKVNEAKDKKRQGVREKGHDYHPAPKKLKGWVISLLFQVKPQNRVVLGDVIVEKVIKGEKSMSGTLSTVNWKGIQFTQCIIEIVRGDSDLLAINRPRLVVQRFACLQVDGISCHKVTCAIINLLFGIQSQFSLAFNGARLIIN